MCATFVNVQRFLRSFVKIRCIRYVNSSCPIPYSNFLRAGHSKRLPINGTKITTVALCSAKDQRSSYSTGNKVEIVSLTIFFVRAAM